MRRNAAVIARYPGCRAAARRTSPRDAAVSSTMLPARGPGPGGWMAAPTRPMLAAIAAKANQRRAPAGVGDQPLSNRSQEKRPERSGGRDGAHGLTAPRRGYRARDCAHHHSEPRARDAQTDEDTARVEAKCAAGPRHQKEPPCVDRGGGYDHWPRAPPIREHPHERLTEAPDQRLERDSEAERGRRHAELARHRRQEEAHALTQARAERQDRGAQPQQHRHGVHPPFRPGPCLITQVCVVRIRWEWVAVKGKVHRPV